MKKFKKYLILSQIVPEKKVQFYINWVSKFYYSCKMDPGSAVAQIDINEYLKSLSKHCEEWQINQARDAIHLYLFYLRRGSVEPGWKQAQPDKAWKAASDEIVRMLRLSWMSFRLQIGSTLILAPFRGTLGFVRLRRISLKFRLSDLRFIKRSRFRKGNGSPRIWIDYVKKNISAIAR